MSTPSVSIPPAGGWKPTKKWLANAVTGVAAILASWIVTGAFDDVERGMSGVLVTGLAAAYFKTNDKETV